MIKMKEIADIQEHERSKPQWSDEETASIINELADHYEIPYEDATHKIITKFLWLPKTIDGKTKWLVTASWQEQFIKEFEEFYDCIIWSWQPTKWL